jgi:hypothetical protein
MRKRRPADKHIHDSNLPREKNNDNRSKDWGDVKCHEGEAARTQFDEIELRSVSTTPDGIIELDQTILDILVVDVENRLPLGRPVIILREGRFYIVFGDYL